MTKKRSKNSSKGIPNSTDNNESALSNPNCIHCGSEFTAEVEVVSKEGFPGGLWHFCFSCFRRFKLH